MKQLKSWSKSVAAGTDLGRIYLHNYFRCTEYKPRFFLCICFSQCVINVAGCVVLLFTYFHVHLLFLVLNVHHMNLNLYDIPFITFFFLLLVSWFLLVIFQNFSFLCLGTFADLLSIFKCVLLNVVRNLGNCGFHYRLE